MLDLTLHATKRMLRDLLRLARCEQVALDLHTKLLTSLYPNTIASSIRKHSQHMAIDTKVTDSMTSLFRDLRIAVVKQEVLPNLYCTGPTSSIPVLLEASLKHSGPLGLAQLGRTDFIIVKLAEDDECQTWREKVTRCRQAPTSYYLDLITRPYRNGERGVNVAQGALALDLHAVDWSKYDIVISLDIAIPTSILAKYPNALWCYYITEPCMPAYTASRSAPLYGYDIFLNQRFDLARECPNHEINFPYNLLHTTIFNEVAHPATLQRRNIFVDFHTFRRLSDSERGQLASFGNLVTNTPRTIDIIQALLRSTFYVQFASERALWGNAMIEAIAAGTIAMGNFNLTRNRSLFAPRTHVSSFSDVLSTLERLMIDTREAKLIQELQQRLLNYYCYAKPLTQLYVHLLAKRGYVSKFGATS